MSVLLVAIHKYNVEVKLLLCFQSFSGKENVGNFTDAYKGAYIFMLLPQGIL